MAQRADVIVVGLGAMGSSVALQLAVRGRSVIGVDRFAPPHDRGSTHGETRITRLAIGEGSEYVPLVQRAHELWPEIERASGTRLLHRTGGLVLGHADSPFLAVTRATAREYGIAHEDLDAAALRSRFPMFAVEEDTEGYLEPSAGYLRPEGAVAAQLGLAERHGAQLRVAERAIAWEATPNSVTVTTEGGILAASELVLCAGPWITTLVPELAELVEVQRQCLFWFPVREGYSALAEMPVFIWDFGGTRPEFAHGVGFYGFPAIDGPAGGLKVGTETSGRSADPDRPAAITLHEAEEMHASYVARRLPWLGEQPLRSATCFYTSTRGSRFVIDRHPAHANVTVVSACSGHGFKHSVAIGEAVAELIVDGASRIDLSPFRFSRQRYGAAA